MTGEELAAKLTETVAAVAESDAAERTRTGAVLAKTKEEQLAISAAYQAQIDALKANPNAADVQAAIAKLEAVKAESDATAATLPTEPPGGGEVPPGGEPPTPEMRRR